MDDYLDKLAARGIVSPSRMDILRQGLDRLKESLVPDYLRDTPSSPQADRALADPNGKPRKIGPPSGPPTLPDIIFGAAGDLALNALPLGKLAAALKGAGLKLAGAGAPLKDITAYHGSPHDFDRFDLSKIGTGEGAQFYGHGLYFAENEGVAKSYRNMADATIGGKKYNDRDPLHVASAQVEESGSRAAAIRDTERRLKESPQPGEFLPKVLQFLRGDQPLPEYKSAGKMYQVAIKTDPEHFLDWDRPLSEQHPKVQEAFRELNLMPGPGVAAPELNGQQILTNLAARRKMTHEETAQSLRAAGIPGIKYLDQGSRSAGEGSRNYVVFDDKLIDIMKKYGLAAGALPAMGAHHFQDQDIKQ